MNMREYYDRRAREYEQIYNRDDPVRQGELAAMRDALRSAMAGRRVLEVACGTGYWTVTIAEVATHVVGIDTAPEVLEIARQKPYPSEKVELCLGDAYALHAVPGVFDAAVAVFWLSHVPKSRLAEFLEQFHRRLAPDAVVFMADNVYIPGVGGELVSRPDCEDTFKRRTLTDGSEHEILKNYYSREQLKTLFEAHASVLDIRVGECYWWLTYIVEG